MKEQLELKLSEVSDLVGELGVLPEKVARRSSQRRRHGGLVSELVKPVEERETRQRHTIFEQEGRLPAILEDKCYPRRTLENREIQVLAQGDNDEATESPDLGPPPVTHFDGTDAVTFNAKRSPRRTSTELIEESEEPNKTSTTASDSRRKRRTSILLEPSSVNGIATSATDEVEMIIPEPEKVDLPIQPRPILKTGAKRKLEMSELEDTSRVAKELDDFIFQRKATVAPVSIPRQSRFSRPPGKPSGENLESLDDRSPERSAQPARKILAPKSTNSPAKRSVITASDKAEMIKDDMPERRPERRVVSRIRTKAAVIDAPETHESQSERQRRVRETQDADIQSHLAPKTPAPDMNDIMSPTSTEPSTKQRPPREMAMTNSVEDVLNGSIGRGSRRARAPVNYAQPNLRDKMRRPGKELVGAVEGLVKLQTEIDQEKTRGGSESIGLESAKQERDCPGQAEENARSRWQVLEAGRGGKSEPASPLGNKTAPSSQEREHATEGAEDGINNAISRLSLLNGLRSSPANRELYNMEEPTSTGDKSTTKQRRPGSASGIRQSERQDDSSGLERRGHIRKSASVTNLPPVNQLNHRRIASSSRVNMDVPSESIGQDSQEPRTRSSALTRRRSMMV